MGNDIAAAPSFVLTHTYTDRCKNALLGKNGDRGILIGVVIAVVAGFFLAMFINPSMITKTESVLRFISNNQATLCAISAIILAIGLSIILGGAVRKDQNKKALALAPVPVAIPVQQPPAPIPVPVPPIARAVVQAPPPALVQPQHQAQPQPQAKAQASPPKIPESLAERAAYLERRNEFYAAAKCYKSLHKWHEALRNLNQLVANPKIIKFKSEVLLKKMKEVAGIGSVSLEDMEKLGTFIENNKDKYKGRFHRVSTKQEGIELAKTLEFYPDGSIYILLNHSDPQTNRPLPGSDKVVGKGSFGTVKFCINYVNCEICVRKSERVMRADKNWPGGFQDMTFYQEREKKVHEALKHIRCVPKVYQTQIYEGKENKEYKGPRNREKRITIMPYYMGGTLSSYKPEMDYRKAVTTILNTLIEIQEKGITHRDIKEANTLVTRDLTPCIADFGLACRSCDQDASSCCGTEQYIPPEIRELRNAGKPHDSQIRTYNKKFDVYSTAILFRGLSKQIAPHDQQLSSLISQLSQYMSNPKFNERPTLQEALIRWNKLLAGG